MNPIKNILLHLDDGSRCRDRLRLSTELAHDYDAHLTGLYVSRFLSESLLVEAPPSGTIMQAFEEEQQMRTARVRQLFEAETGALDARREFRDEEGDAAFWLSVYGRYADLIVVHQPAAGELDSGVGGVPGALALASGRPVLVVPDTSSRSLSAGRAMIAWNGTREAARAVADSLPFLARAQQVDVVRISEGRGPADDLCDAASLCRHLASHGIEAAPVEIPQADMDVPESLLSRAAAQAVGLIVLGAYGHSRVRELVLGGVTQHLLKHSAVPLLLSH